MTEIAVLGAGMAGFGAAHRLHTAGARATLYEKRGHYGGHTSSYRFDGGFFFDEGPHVSFTQDERIPQLFAQNVNRDYQTLTTPGNNYWKGYWINPPPQCNLYRLPQDLLLH